MLQSHRWHNGRGLQGIVCNALPSDPMSSADMFDGEAGDGRKIFILEDMTYEQLSDFHMRLCENDVEYHDLKVRPGYIALFEPCRRSRVVMTPVLICFITYFNMSRYNHIL